MRGGAMKILYWILTAIVCFIAPAIAFVAEWPQVVQISIVGFQFACLGGQLYVGARLYVLGS
ncbi:hypothetical protein NBRC116587_38860 [Pseudoteredinibacter isoporae]